jgi:hypothetical protein
MPRNIDEDIHTRMSWKIVNSYENFLRENKALDVISQHVCMLLFHNMYASISVQI